MHKSNLQKGRQILLPCCWLELKRNCVEYFKLKSVFVSVIKKGAANLFVDFFLYIFIKTRCFLVKRFFGNNLLESAKRSKTTPTGIV